MFFYFGWYGRVLLYGMRVGYLVGNIYIWIRVVIWLGGVRVLGNWGSDGIDALECV